jgi:hypothetical protein
MDVATTATTIVQIGTAINGVILLALGTSFAVILAKAFGGRELSYKGMKVPVDRTWVLLAVLTLVHTFFAWLLLRTVGSFLNCASMDQAAQVWIDLTQRDAISDRLAFFQMVERARLEGWEVVGILFLISDVAMLDLFNDPALVVQVAAAALMCLAVLRLFHSTFWLKLETTLAAIALVAANVIIVSAWALAVSDISRSSAGVGTAIGSGTYEWLHPSGLPSCAN